MRVLQLMSSLFLCAVCAIHGTTADTTAEPSMQAGSRLRRLAVEGNGEEPGGGPRSLPSRLYDWLFQSPSPVPPPQAPSGSPFPEPLPSPVRTGTVSSGEGGFPAGFSVREPQGPPLSEGGGGAEGRQPRQRHPRRPRPLPPTAEERAQARELQQMLDNAAQPKGVDGGRQAMGPLLVGLLKDLSDLADGRPGPFKSS
uniref:Transmembrane protein n=1 Tax=Toxoplasma gondii (strain ATCC 50861 / VEG) TaxID=432359 RepID=A0A0F7V8Q7_TOXGV|nr:TPA: hypothetical protein BN1205_067275 [Toxoplasma gondii VEG]